MNASLRWLLIVALLQRQFLGYNCWNGMKKGAIQQCMAPFLYAG